MIHNHLLFYKYVKYVSGFPRNNLSKTPSISRKDTLKSVGITNKSTLKLVSNHGVLANRISMIRGYSSKEYDPLGRRAVLIRKHVRNGSMNIITLSYTLGLSLETTRKCVKEMCLQGFLSYE